MIIRVSEIFKGMSALEKQLGHYCQAGLTMREMRTLDDAR